jgi:hypothetical protein
MARDADEGKKTEIFLVSRKYSLRLCERRRCGQENTIYEKLGRKRNLNIL